MFPGNHRIAADNCRCRLVANGNKPCLASLDRARIAFDSRMRNNPRSMSSTIPAHVCALKLLFIACVCLNAWETTSFAADTDRAAAVLQRELGVTIGGGDGSSFEKAIIVHSPKVEMVMLAAYEYIALRYRLARFSQWHISIRKSKYYLVMTYNYTVSMGPFPNRKTRVFYFDMSNYFKKKSS